MSAGARALPALWLDELRPFPGRMHTVWRFMLVSALVILISMTLQVPVMGLSLTIVFFAAQENTTLTWRTCVFSVIGTTVSIGVALLLVKFTMGDPGPRLLGGFGFLFVAIYFMRVSRLGQLGGIAAMGIAYTLTMLDAVNDPEFMTRFLLWVWVWVATVYPILVTALLTLAATGCALMRKDTAPLAPIPAQQLQAEIGMTLALGGGYRAEPKRR
jgi:multidrug resistance protein MdtO